MDELVLVVKKDIINDSLGENNQYLINSNESEFKNLVYQNQEFLLRSVAENDFSMKQIISYCLVECDNKVFVTQRTKKQTEVRLHNKYSVGIGGHINPTDLDKNDLVEKGMLRELHEEVIIKGDFSYEFLGLINSNNAEVSLVHTGLCYLVKVKDYDCAVNETKKMTGQWVSIDQLDEYYDSMEDWSKIVLNTYLKK